MDIIKCHICRLDNRTCNHVCIDMMDDVSSLYKEGYTGEDVIPKEFCTLHSCEFNKTGLQCSLDKCVKFDF